MADWYYEIVRNLRRRGDFVIQDDVWDIILKEGRTSELYKSVFLYGKEATQEMSKKGSVAKNFSVRSAPWIPIDIDRGNNSDEKVNTDFKLMIEALLVLGLSEDNMNLWYSGTGYHIDIHADCFGLEPQVNYPFIIKNTIKKLLNSTDDSIYTNASLIRLPFSLNKKQNRYKIYLTFSEARTLDYTEVLELATIDNLDERIKIFLEEQEDKYGSNELKDHLVLEVPKLRTLSRVIEPSHIVSCMYRILNEKPQKGSRNLTTLRIASFCARAGIPSKYAKLIALEWNANQLDENIVIKNVEYTYSKGYKFGCDDKILKAHCSTRCVHYRAKDLEIDYLSANDMQKQLIDRLMLDPETLGFIALTKMLGLPETEDCDIMPGELVTVIGDTGVNKSGFVQNIIMGVDFINNTINENYQLNTILFSPELAPWLMQRRFLQIASGLSKEELMIPHKAKKAYKEYGHLIEHVKLVNNNEIWLHNIIRAVEETGCKLVVVDYAELIYVEGISFENSTARLQKIFPALSNLAKSKDIIVIVVSQVSRSTDKKVTLSSGFGSSSIEKSSRKVIVINGDPKERVREISMEKNQDGSIFSMTMENFASFRLQRLLTPMELEMRSRQLDYNVNNQQIKL